MNAKFWHPSAEGAAERAPTSVTGVRAVRPRGAETACCCVANAVVRVVLPPTPARPRETELLLCGHHYRVSRHALATARAAVYELPGTPEDTAAWIHGERHSSPVPVG
jgi:hypothetical protein